MKLVVAAWLLVAAGVPVLASPMSWEEFCKTNFPSFVPPSLALQFSSRLPELRTLLANPRGQKSCQGKLYLMAGMVGKKANAEFLADRLLSAISKVKAQPSLLEYQRQNVGMLCLALGILGNRGFIGTIPVLRELSEAFLRPGDLAEITGADALRGLVLTGADAAQMQMQKLHQLVQDPLRRDLLETFLMQIKTVTAKGWTSIYGND